MKHLPNLLTLTNLFCGCIAIAYILTAQPYLTMSITDGRSLPSWDWVYGMEQVYLGTIFIGIAAVCDMLDGMVARALNVFSPLGKDLDSLADVVSFGVAPSVILFKFLWDACMGQKGALDVSMLAMAPAFLIACFAALRLAKFNVTADTQKSYFIGMPTPAVGLFVASIPWISRYNVFGTGVMLQNKWLLYAIIAVLCWLMVSSVKFIKMAPAKWNMAYAWPQLVIVLVTIPALFFLHVLAIPIAFILYILLSLIYKHPDSIKQTI
jgi:CDP-diacylglycerol--serine O-phosphatidyltransferase